MTGDFSAEDPTRRVAFLGSGAMGCFLGAAFAGAGHSVTLVDCWPAHVAALTERGLTLETDAGTAAISGLSATREPSGVRGARHVFVCVKSTATEQAIAAATPWMEPDATLVTLQNGLGNVETLCRYWPSESIVAGVTASGATLLAPAHVRIASIGETVIGGLGGNISPRAETLAAMLARAGLPVRVTRSIQGAIWTKLLANVGINALAALTLLRNGAIFATPEGAGLAERAIREAALVAKAEGVVLDTDDPVAYGRQVAEKTARNRASMLQDILAGRTTEIASINGEIVRRGQKLGIPVPVNETLYALVVLRQQSEHSAV